MTDSHNELANEILRPLLKRTDVGVYELIGGLGVAAGLLIASLKKEAPTERTAEYLVPMFFDITQRVVRLYEEGRPDA